MTTSAQQRLDWCIREQAALVADPHGSPHLVALGLADLVGEEVLIRLEERS
jgi:hypothetical protein